MNIHAKMHLGGAAFWLLMLIPTLIWWHSSVLWVAILSLYALLIGHLASFEASNNHSVDKATHVKLDAIADGLADMMTALQHELQDDKHAIQLQKDIAELKQAVGIEDKRKK